MRTILLLTALTLALPTVVAMPGTGKTVSLRLKNGTKMVGKLVTAECTDKAVVLRDLRSRRKVTIPWSKLRPDMARKLRIELGFELAEAKGGHMIEADQLRNRTGSVFTGVILNRATATKDGHYKLKTAEGILTIRVGDVREQRKVQVDARVVYTPEELFAKRIQEKEPESALDHYQLAEYARLIGALAAAKEHYEIVLRMDDPKYPASAIERMLADIDKRINSAEADGLLRSVEKHIVYHRFEKARIELDAFKERFAEDEAFARAIEMIEAKYELRHKEYYTSQVARSLRDAVKAALGKKVKEPDLDIREAMNFASGEASSEDSVSFLAINQIAEKLKLKPEEVVELWKERPKRAIYKAFYRDGTFIIVDDLEDALAKAPKAKAPKGKRAPSAPKPKARMKPDRWWEGKVKGRRWSDLRDFLYAYWAEKSGAVELLPPKEEACPTCAGKGYLMQTIMTTQGNVIFADRCTNCYMAKHFRVVRFR